MHTGEYWSRIRASIMMPQASTVRYAYIKITQSPAFANTRDRCLYAFKHKPCCMLHASCFILTLFALQYEV